MEKSRNTATSVFRKRLLTILLSLAAVPLFALSVVPEAESAVCGAQTIFTLDLADFPPSSVEFVSPALPADATCLAAKKSAYFADDGTSGTRIELWIAFYKEGYYTLPNLEVYAEGLNYSVPFEPFQVYRNPQDVAPEIFLEYERGVKDGTARAGDEIVFSVYARYFMSLASFSYDIPENALFRLVEQQTKADGTRRDFSADKVKIATFAWIPLSAGVAALPDVHLVVTSYSASRTDLSLADTGTLHILDAPATIAEEAKTESLFAYAFLPTADTEDDSEIAEPVSTEIAVLTRLRDKERRSLPFSNTRLVRQRVESAMGLVPGEDEPYVIVPIAFWVLCIVAAILAIIFFRRRRFVRSFLSTFAFVSVLVSAIVFTARQIVPYGVFTGGEIYPIPERTSATSFYIHGGNRVRIVEATGNWTYISTGSIEGWVPTEMVEPIKSLPAPTLK